jgi:DNA-binding beta-propeller fold protein YncE
MKHREKKAKSRRGILGKIMCYLCCFWLFLPLLSHAELKGTPIVYVGSITEDEEGKKISFPSNIFVDPVTNEIYITDSKGRVIIYTSDFFPLFTLDRSKGIESPLSISLDKEGNLYILQSSTKESPKDRISVYNARLKWKRDIFLEDFEGVESFVPSHISVDKQGNIYLIGSAYTGVIVLSNQGLIKKIISPEEDRKVTVANVTIDNKGRIYLVSETEGHIYVYDDKGNFLFKFGEKGGSSGKLSRPVAVGVDNLKERIYVVDYMRHTISTYNAKDGTYLFEFGGLGWGEGWFQHPKDIAIDLTGRILIADTFNDRIEVLQSTD